jgi:hypothetical protein
MLLYSRVLAIILSRLPSCLMFASFSPFVAAHCNGSDRFHHLHRVYHILAIVRVLFLHLDTSVSPTVAPDLHRDPTS